MASSKVHRDVAWRKATRSNNSGNCVEVALGQPSDEQREPR